jgi:hypothetical protein
MMLRNEEFRILLSTVKEAVVSTVCQQLGVENLGALTQKINGLETTVNKINTDLATMVDTKVNNAVANPDYIRNMAIAVSRQNREHRQSQDEERRNQFRAILATLIKAELSQLNALADRADEAHLAQGKSPAEWPTAVEAWFNSQVEAMVATITSLVNKNKARGVDLRPIAGYMLLKGIEPADSAAVRREMESDTNLEGLLKKA